MGSCYVQRCIPKLQGFLEEQPRMGLFMLGRGCLLHPAPIAAALGCLAAFCGGVSGGPVPLLSSAQLREMLHKDI